jgi:hypothetical protein
MFCDHECVLLVSFVSILKYVTPVDKNNYTGCVRKNGWISQGNKIGKTSSNPNIIVTIRFASPCIHWLNSEGTMEEKRIPRSTFELFLKEKIPIESPRTRLFSEVLGDNKKIGKRC